MLIEFENFVLTLSRYTGLRSRVLQIILDQIISQAILVTTFRGGQPMFTAKNDDELSLFFK